GRVPRAHGHAPGRLNETRPRQSNHIPRTTAPKATLIALPYSVENALPQLKHRAHAMSVVNINQVRPTGMIHTDQNSKHEILQRALHYPLPYLRHVPKAWKLSWHKSCVN